MDHAIQDMGSNPFNHPFKPYDIQVDLMNAMYDAISNYKIGLFESPTGTGKTLSIICSSMTWLRTYKKSIISGSVEADKKREELKSDEESESEDEPSWVNESYKNNIVNRSKSLAEEYELHLDSLVNERDFKLHTFHGTNSNPKSKMVKLNQDKEAKADTEFMPDDYYDNGERQKNQSEMLNQEIKELLSKIDGGGHKSVELINECPTSILYASRTHSQLNQFADQVRLVSFPSSFEGTKERTKFLPLSSRKQLCIHPKISKYKDLTTINDACIDLQQSKDAKTCGYLPKTNDSNSTEIIKKFTDLSFTEISDIEDLTKIGSSLNICPYYSVRNGIELSEIMALPYQLLLQKSSRDALKLSIKDSIIIIDEAHNLLDAITNLNSVSITQSELTTALESLKFYLDKFAKKLNAGNRINLMKLIKLIEVLKNFMDESLNRKLSVGKEINVNDFFLGSTADLLNIHSLETYLTTSKIAYKIENYIERLSNIKREHSSTPLLFKITSFLRSLSNPSKEGRFFWDKTKDSLSINYMLLDPSELFREIVEEARCVLLCGGTMEPMTDYTDFLFPYIKSDEIKKFSCGHIIPKENLEVFPISKSLSGNVFDFSFDKRNEVGMINDLGFSILKLIQDIPYGVVIFFPSYKYLDQVTSEWRKSKIYDKINCLKKIHNEPKSSSEVGKVLSEFSDSIIIDNGAVLLSVVGGKLSEGINFADDLARAVIMIGLPFPNAFSGELIAKRKYIISRTIDRGGTKVDAMENAKKYYENICMRAVNQSVGRAIRHIGDYSTIYLVDQRYEADRIQNKLSGWVKERISCRGKSMSFEEVLTSTKKFFSSKQKK